MHFHDLARLLGPDQPFYGLNALGLEKGQVPHTRIEDIAAHYLEEIRTIQSNGPYFIGGAGDGCFIALEMAHQLKSQGQNSAKIVLLAPPPLKTNISSTKLYTYGRRLKIFFLGFNHVIKHGPLMPAIKDSFSNRILYRWKIFHRYVPIEIHRRRRFEKTLSEALLSYTPNAYHGRFTCILRDEFARKPQKGIGDWCDLAAGGIDIRFVPGNVYSMWHEPHVKILAEKLTACLNEAQINSW
jgi:thioesterase domain-containing protein